MDMHVIIKGATGFIGSAIAREFRSAGVRVTMLIRSQSQLQRLGQLPPETLVNIDQMERDMLIDRLAADAPSVFIDCAWRGVGGRDRNEAFQVSHNLPMTLDTVNLAAAIGCKQWISFGSQAEYGNHNRRLDETAAFVPTTVYGKAKLAVGTASLALCEAKGLAGVWIRVFSTYGPGDAPNWFIPYVTQEFLAGRRPKLTKCDQLWDYLFIEDAARAVRALANQCTSGVFNLGSGVAHPLRDVVETIRAELGSDLEPVYGAVAYRPDQVMHLEADIRRLTEATGWRPETMLVEGIRRTVAFEKIRQV